MVKRKRKQQHVQFSLHMIFDLVALVLIWRGIWNLADEYLFPGLGDLSNVVGIVMGLLFLFVNDHLFGEYKKK